MEETYSAPQAHEVRSEAGCKRVQSERDAALRTDPAQIRHRLTQSFLTVRRATETLASRLSPEDQCLQSMPDCSPAKWHRAHTTWFFEEFLLVAAGIPRFRDEYAYLFNSYYETAGARHPRPQRGILSRPSAAEVTEYRRVVDARVLDWLEQLTLDALEQVAPLLELGVAHEQQHQELLLTDVLHAFSLNPLKPAYLSRETSTLPIYLNTDGYMAAPKSNQASNGVGSCPLFKVFTGGVAEIGAAAGGFSFDNERPRHRVYIEPFELATRPIVMSEVKAFIQAGGYTTPSLWLSEGLDWVRRTGATAPLHSRCEEGEMFIFTLRGEQPAPDGMIAAHLNFYEADAIARFLGARLPTEAEWEVAVAELQNVASDRPTNANWLESGRLIPSVVDGLQDKTSQHFLGDVWEWTSSAYSPYPGYAPAPGAVGEYNGKFMVNQLVLRGGSCLTPAGHIRATYRNFWPAMTSFQMTGGRLARSVK